jgi:activating signal cointegrator complex subunit 1
MARKAKSMTKGYKGGQGSGGPSHSDKPKRPPLTHFLCIPLVTATSRPQLEASLRHFQESVANGVPNASIDEIIPDPTSSATTTPLFSPKAVRPIGTIHFTLGVMSLMSEDRVEEAVKFLKSLDLKGLIDENVHTESSQSAIEIAQNTLVKDVKQSSLQTTLKSSTTDTTNSNDSLLSISLTSLHSMHSPKSTSILYAAPHDPSGRLLPLCTTLRSLFEKEGHLVPDDRPLKLHATIVNTIYAKSGGRGGGSIGTAKTIAGSYTQTAGDNTDGKSAVFNRSVGHGPNAKALLRFDAEGLLEQWKDFIWVEGFPLEKLSICKMGATKITAANGEVIGEEYEEIASIPFVI